MHRLHGVHISDQHLVWKDRERVYYVGPDSEFRDCRIDIVLSARALILVRTRFIGCDLRFKRQLNNFRLHGAYFEGCRIEGRLSGCDFGRRDDETDFPMYFAKAGIVDTDLSGARLDGCRFINCDLATVRLPRWPCFTVPNAESVREHALKLPWPKRTYIIPNGWNKDPPGTVAVTDDARGICKRYEVTEAELRAVVEQIPGVIM